MAGGGIIAVAGEREQSRRDLAGGRLPSDEVLANPEPFQRAVQPFAPLLVAMAVADEGSVFQGDRFRHGGSSDASLRRRALGGGACGASLGGSRAHRLGLERSIAHFKIGLGALCALGLVQL